MRTHESLIKTRVNVATFLLPVRKERKFKAFKEH
jgi:hypothetical protein